LLAGWGCSHAPSRESAPAIDAQAAGAAAIDQYDANHDGAISGTELDKCPALKSALKHYDTNGDGKVTAATIADRIGLWQKSKAAVVTAGVVIRLDGRPLSGANVTLEPEKFLGANVQQAKGTTNSEGVASLDIDGKRGANFGLYRVLVSKTEAGKDTIPARYNANTELGLEISPDMFMTPGLPAFDLKSR
jgi:hypothetical protein